MSTFVHCALGDEPFHSLLLVVFCLVLLSTIAAYLGCVTLSADVTVVVAAEALFHSAGAVVGLALAISGSANSTTIEDARLRVASLVSHPMYEISALGITV
jgi:hypothetical protein